MPYLYILDKTKREAFYICRTEGGLTENIGKVLRPGLISHLTDKITMEGAELRSNLLGKFTVKPTREEETD